MEVDVAAAPSVLGERVLEAQSASAPASRSQ